MELLDYTFSNLHLAIFIFVAFLIGMAKMGVPGVGMAAVPLLAIVFGGKSSSGIMLVILCLADVFAVIYYHRHASWTHLIRLLPAALVGVILGTTFGHSVNDEVFKLAMAIIILLSIGVMLLTNKIGTQKNQKPQYWLAILMGVFGGFTSMVGNLAGPVMALYLLLMRFPKKEFIGTTAWFFMILNLLKVPFHVFVWHTINLQSFLLDLSVIPVVFIGAIVGLIVVKRIPEPSYRWFVILATIASSVLMIV